MDVNPDEIQHMSRHDYEQTLNRAIEHHRPDVAAAMILARSDTP